MITDSDRERTPYAYDTEEIGKLANRMYQGREEPEPRALCKHTSCREHCSGKSIDAAKKQNGSMFYFIKDTPQALMHEGPVVYDVHKYRSDFPILKRRVHGNPLIWFDNSATTQKPECVIAALKKYYSKYNSNVHRGAHALAKEATAGYENAREKTAEFIGAGKNEIVFVRGATEAVNLVANTWGKQNLRSGDEILITEMEHHSNIVPWQMLAQETGCKLKAVPFSETGEICLEEYADMFSPRTKLAAVTHVSNVLGTVNPVVKMIEIAHSRGAKVLVDGAQAAPHMPVDVGALNADFYVLSGHKIYGPTGIGVLYAKKELLESMPAYQGGGGMIRSVSIEGAEYKKAPEKFEAGTVNIADAIALGAAVDYLKKIGMDRIQSYESRLTQHLMSRMGSLPGVRIIGYAPGKAGVVSFVMDNISSERIAKELDRQGIAIRAGHHCAQPALKRFGLKEAARASLGLYNTFNEIDTFVRCIGQIARK